MQVRPPQEFGRTLKLCCGQALINQLAGGDIDLMTDGERVARFHRWPPCMAATLERTNLCLAWNGRRGEATLADNEAGAANAGESSRIPRLGCGSEASRFSDWDI